MCGSGGSPPSGAGGTGQPGSTATCPPRPRQDVTYVLEGRWLTTEAYCGDSARLEVTVTPLPPDGEVSVEILHPSTGAGVQTLTGQMRSGRMETSWVAKAQTRAWRDDQIRFRATASSVGATGTSSNQFRFRRRPLAGWTTVDTTRPVPATCGATPKKVLYDAKLEGAKVRIKLKLRATSTALSADDLTRFKTQAKENIESVWNDGFRRRRFHRQHCQRHADCDCEFDCCKAEFRLDAEFVETGDQWLIKVVAQAPPDQPSIGSWVRYNDSEWAFPAGSPASEYAHEAGHTMGQYDEYVTSCNDPSGTQPAPPPAGEENLMSHADNTTLLNRHYRWAKSFLNDHSDGDPYDIIPVGS